MRAVLRGGIGPNKGAPQLQEPEPDIFHRQDSEQINTPADCKVVPDSSGVPGAVHLPVEGNQAAVRAFVGITSKTVTRNQETHRCTFFLSLDLTAAQTLQRKR